MYTSVRLCDATEARLWLHVGTRLIDGGVHVRLQRHAVRFAFSHGRVGGAGQLAALSWQRCETPAAVSGSPSSTSHEWKNRFTSPTILPAGLVSAGQCGTSEHGLPSNTAALITLDCGTMRPGQQMVLITWQGLIQHDERELVLVDCPAPAPAGRWAGRLLWPCVLWIAQAPRTSEHRRSERTPRTAEAATLLRSHIHAAQHEQQAHPCTPHNNTPEEAVAREKAVVLAGAHRVLLLQR